MTQKKVEIHLLRINYGTYIISPVFLSSEERFFSVPVRLPVSPCFLFLRPGTVFARLRTTTGRSIEGTGKEMRWQQMRIELTDWESTTMIHVIPCKRVCGQDDGAERTRRHVCAAQIKIYSRRNRLFASTMCLRYVLNGTKMEMIKLASDSRRNNFITVFITRENWK